MNEPQRADFGRTSHRAPAFVIDGRQPGGEIRHLDQFEELPRPGMALGLADPAHLQTERDVVEAVELREQRIALKPARRLVTGKFVGESQQWSRNSGEQLKGRFGVSSRACRRTRSRPLE